MKFSEEGSGIPEDKVETLLEHFKDCARVDSLSDMALAKFLIPGKLLDLPVMGQEYALWDSVIRRLVRSNNGSVSLDIEIPDIPGIKE